MIYKSLLARLSWVVFLSCSTYLAIAQSAAAGKDLFRNQCGSCHNKNMVQDMTGPALGGVQERWAEYPEEDLYNWIKNSTALIEAGHPRAVEVYNQYNKLVMMAFPNLADEDITSMLMYIDEVYTGGGTTAAAPATGVTAGDDAEEGWLGGSLIYLLILGFLALLAFVLARVIIRLQYLSAVSAGQEVEGPAPWWSMFTSKTAIGLFVFALVVIGGYTTVNNAIGLNRMQDYQPEQPIKFSHATHAGLHQIDCQYCHDGARRSKHSVIPATNTCMNCHKAIKVGSTYGTAELSKIYASIGYDPNSDQYIENYEDLSQDEIKQIFTTWVANQYVMDNGKLDRRGERRMEEEWQGIVNSLTSETKPNVQGPIEWVRIHNLPDHVYFNHSQHVTVGQVACEQCHGDVGEMEIVKQHSPLSMGWCINCHRESEVDFNDNPYYASYAKYHEEIQAGTRSSVTVEDIGGLECQKCHY
ncbi:MAG: c-type cytochrome [Saprospiraceae bacterium]|nr:c-type cytochrome [Saprospiraceae bacterium]